MERSLALSDKDAAGELPVVRSLGMHEVVRGKFVIFEQVSQGDKVLERDIIGERDAGLTLTKFEALDRLKVEIHRRLVVPAFRS